MAFAKVLEEAAAGVAKTTTKNAKRIGRNIAKAEKRVAKAKNAQVVAKQTEENVVGGFDDPNYRSLSETRNYSLEAQIDDMRKQRARTGEIIGFNDPRYRSPSESPGYGSYEERIKLQNEWEASRQNAARQNVIENRKRNMQENESRKRQSDKDSRKAQLKEASDEEWIRSKREEKKQAKTLERAMFEKRIGAGKAEGYMYDSTKKQWIADLNDMGNPLVRKSMANEYGIANHEGMSGRAFKESVYQHHKNRIDAGPTFTDKMMGYRVPQIATGLLITAGVVSSLSGSKGQQSNAQLYGQAPMPGM